MNLRYLSIANLFIYAFFLSSFIACQKNENLPSQELRPVSTQHNLYDILFVDSMLGFIVGGARYASSDLLVTEDGGENWNLSRLPPDGNKAVYAVAAAENKVLAAGFDGKVFRYDEADKSWSYMQTNWWEWFQGICITPNANSFVVGGIGYQHG